MPDTAMTAEYKVPADEARVLFARGVIERARGGDGYDVMAEAEKGEDHWTAVNAWGSDGWDLGDWPYVVVYARHASEGYELATWVEGDLDIWRFPEQELLYQAIDEIAFFYWKAKNREWVDGIEERSDMPDRLRGPFSWERTTA